MDGNGRTASCSGYAADMLQLIWATALHCIRMVRVIVYCIVGTYTVVLKLQDLELRLLLVDFLTLSNIPCNN